MKMILQQTTLRKAMLMMNKVTAQPFLVRRYLNSYLVMKIRTRIAAALINKLARGTGIKMSNFKLSFYLRLANENDLGLYNYVMV